MPNLELPFALGEASEYGSALGIGGDGRWSVDRIDALVTKSYHGARNRTAFASARCDADRSRSLPGLSHRSSSEHRNQHHEERSSKIPQPFNASYRFAGLQKPPSMSLLFESDGGQVLCDEAIRSGTLRQCER